MATAKRTKYQVRSDASKQRWVRDDLKDVLETLTAEPGVQIDSLLPNNWQKKEQKSDFKACHITPKLALR